MYTTVLLFFTKKKQNPSWMTWIGAFTEELIVIYK